MSAVTPPNPSSVFDVKRNLDFFLFCINYWVIQILQYTEFIH